MRSNWFPRCVIVGCALGVLIAGAAGGAEIITADDIKQEIITEEHLVKVVDNAVFLLDSSGSMNKPFQGTDKSRYQVVMEMLQARNAYYPDLGQNVGFYVYTPWQEVYPMQPFDRALVATALFNMPKEGSGATWLTEGLEKVADVLKTLSGKTALFVITDGTYSDNRRPIFAAKRLVDQYDVCIYVISTAEEKVNAVMIDQVASLNSCSRVIPFADFINRPEYTTGALFQVKATERLVTHTDKQIVGLKADDLTFHFDKYDLRAEDAAELEQVVAFLKEYPESWASVRGYTDNVGSEEYNLSLSRMRAETVAEQLKDAGISGDRIVVLWYGAANPVASNDTEEGREQNRRVEIAVGMN